MDNERIEKPLDSYIWKPINHIDVEILKDFDQDREVLFEQLDKYFKREVVRNDSRRSKRNYNQGAR